MTQDRKLSSDERLIRDLRLLNRIAKRLNRAVDVHTVLQETLADLLALLELETGWIYLIDRAAQDQRWGKGYRLAAAHNLPPALDLEKSLVWLGGCRCQDMCMAGELNEAYNILQCTRLENAEGDRHELVVHATVPITAGKTKLGILNVAADDWSAFNDEALELLTNVGAQLGIALERARLYDLLRERRIDEQLALLNLSSQLLTLQDMDEVLEHIVETVPRMLNVDACAILLPAQDEQYLEFRAATGWRNDPITDKRKVPADERSTSGMVMNTQQVLLVDDLERSDPRPMWAPEWIMHEGFRGHAVVPLIAEGKSVGVMMIDAREPRLFDEDEVRFMQLVANQAAIAIEQARLREEKERRRLLEDEMNLGRQIQLNLLPAGLPEIPGWEFAAINQSALRVSGDFYDYFDLPGKPGRLGIVVADVMGKGVPAALFMALSRTVIRTTALSGRPPASALMRANELIRKDSRESTLLTAVYAELDTQAGTFRYANAGHHRPLWFQAAAGKCRELDAKGVVMGVFDHIEIEEEEVRLQPGDYVVIFTDGVTDIVNPQGVFYGLKRLRKLLQKHVGKSAQALMQIILDDVVEFAAGAPRMDDLTLFIIQRCH